MKDDTGLIEISAITTYFDRLRGITLELWGAIQWHNSFIFRGTQPDDRYIIFQLHSVRHIDILPVMHNCHFRIPTDAENTRFQTQLTSFQANFENLEWYFEGSGFSFREGRIIIECDEGIFSVWAFLLRLKWMDSPDLGVSSEQDWDFDAPLWINGPPLADL